MTTGSFFNNVLGNVAAPEPEIGMGATRLLWTDRIAGTIIEIYRNKAGQVIELAIQEDTATRADGNGMSDSQAYTYAPNPDGAISRYTLRKNGSWVRRGDRSRNGERLLVGDRRQYHDYSF